MCSVDVYNMNQFHTADVTKIGLRIVDPYLLELTDALSVASWHIPSVSVDDCTSNLTLGNVESEALPADRVERNSRLSTTVDTPLPQTIQVKHATQKTPMSQYVCAGTGTHSVVSGGDYLTPRRYDDTREEYSTSVVKANSEKIQQKSYNVYKKSDVMHPNISKQVTTPNYFPSAYCFTDTGTAVHQIHTVSNNNEKTDRRAGNVSNTSLNQLKSNAKETRKSLIAPNDRGVTHPKTASKTSDLLPFPPPFRCGQRPRRCGTSSLKHPVVAIHPQTQRVIYLLYFHLDSNLMPAYSIA